MRVLVLTYVFTDDDPRYGGEGRVVWETTKALAEAGVKVVVVTSIKNIKSAPHPNITLYKVPFAKKNFLNFDDGELFKMFLFSIPLIFIHRIDVIHHLPTSGPDPFARFKFGRIFAESADPGWDYENPKFGDELKLDRAQKNKEAGYTPTPSLDLWRRVARRFFTFIGVYESYPRGTDIFFYRQPSMGPMLNKLRPEAKSWYVPNGVDPRVFSKSVTPFIERTGGGLRFLHVGSLSRRKGVHYLIKAFIEVLKTHPECELILAGSGEEGFVRELKELASLHSQIRFIHGVSNADLPGVYASADVFCLAILSGGSTPTVFAEALATGLPVIGSTDTGSGESIKEYDAGYVVEAGDVTELASAMLSCVEDESTRLQKAKNALAASKFFTWAHIADSIIKGYREVLAKKQ